MEYPFLRYFLNFLCILLARLVAGLRLFFFGDRLGVNNFPRVFSIYISVFFNRIERLKKTLPAGFEPATLRLTASHSTNWVTGARVRTLVTLACSYLQSAYTGNWTQPWTLEGFCTNHYTMYACLTWRNRTTDLRMITDDYSPSLYQLS